MLDHLVWRSIKQRRADARLTMLYKIYHSPISLIPRYYLWPGLYSTEPDTPILIALYSYLQYPPLIASPFTPGQYINETVYPILFLLIYALWSPSKLQYVSWERCYFSLSQAWDKEKHLIMSSGWESNPWPSTHWWDALTTELQVVSWRAWSFTRFICDTSCIPLGWAMSKASWVVMVNKINK